MTGFVDASIVPRTAREAAVLAEIKHRRLTLHRLHAQGDAVRLTGPGIYVTASGLNAIQPIDLIAVDPVSVNRQRLALDSQRDDDD